jgi:predicted GIY-YIG superfamily endonuclease
VHYVYQIQSVDYPEEFYTGSTDNLKARLDSHNAGRSPHTAKHKPWRLITYHAFANREKALDFEAYLKSGSGRAFTKCHLR